MARSIKHTPAPWRLDPECLFDDGICATVEGHDGVALVEVFPTKLNCASGQWSQEQEANAHLIAAAPQLLEALKILKEDFSDGEGCYCGQIVGGTNAEGEPLHKCGQCIAEAAIAKAEGRA